VRRWVRDPNSPQVKAELEAMARFHRESRDEQAIMDFTEAAAADAMKDVPY
jgi:hypothetical protein